jgi:hypothetical protein
MTDGEILRDLAQAFTRTAAEVVEAEQILKKKRHGGEWWGESQGERSA